jgi:senataxin
MEENRILLIQGPPGTGKTSTIIGIIDILLEKMLQESSPYKIQVCAPSDTAIDHILTRIYE